MDADTGLKPTNKLNITIPLDVAQQLQALCERMSCTKKELTVNALRQYIAIKNRQLDLAQENPDGRITSEAILRSWQDKKKQNIASVMIY